MIRMDSNFDKLNPQSNKAYKFHNILNLFTPPVLSFLKSILVNTKSSTAIGSKPISLDHYLNIKYIDLWSPSTLVRKYIGYERGETTYHSQYLRRNCSQRCHSLLSADFQIYSWIKYKIFYLNESGSFFITVYRWFFRQDNKHFWIEVIAILGWKLWHYVLT